MINIRIPELKQIETTTRWQRAWGILRFELLYLSWGVMEIALIAPVALALLPWLRYWSVPAFTLWLVLLLFIPFNLIRLFDQLNIGFDRQQMLMLVGVLLTAVFTVRYLFYPALSFSEWLNIVYANFTTSRNSYWARDMVLFGVVAFTWWRGIVLVTREPNVDRLTPQLRSGLLYLAPLAVWLATVRLNWTIAPFLLLFVLSGLTAVSLTRVEQAEQEQQAYMAVATPRWLLAIALSSLLIIGLAAVFSYGASSLTNAHFVSGFSALWQPIRFAGSVVGLTFLYLAFPLAGPLERFLNWLVSYWNRMWSQLLTEAEPIEATGQAPDSQEIIDSLEQGSYVDLINWQLVLFALLLIAIFIAIRLMRVRYRARRLAATDGRLSQIQRLQKEANAKELNWLDRLRQSLGNWRNQGTIRTIRRIYQRMSYTAAAVGFPRGEAETPYEYVPNLLEVWPDNREDVLLITEAYVKIRYGTLPETKEEFDAILTAWRRLEETKPNSERNSKQ